MALGIWKHHLVCYGPQAIEKVQHRAIKIIPELTLFLSKSFTEVISIVTCLLTAKRGNNIPIPTNSSLLQYQCYQSSLVSVFRHKRTLLQDL